MSLLYTPRSYDAKSKRQAVTDLTAKTVPDRDFYVLVLGAIALAVCAIFSDSLAVLIASMIIAPLASPILALGLSAVVGDARWALKSLGMLAVSVVAAIVLSCLATYFFGEVRVDPVFISFAGNLSLATIVALVAGAIGAYGLIRPKVGEAMMGIGIAVSLMPPLVATGIGLADGNGALAHQTFIVFLVNVVGIFVSSTCVFALFGMRGEYEQAE